MKTRLTLIVFSGLFALSSLRAQIRSDFVLIPGGFDPHISLDANGNLHVTTGSADKGIYYGLFDSLGQEIKAPKIISISNFGQTPRLGISEDNVVVVWREATTINSTIQGQLLTINGDTVSGNLFFNDSCGDCESFSPDVTFLNDSTFIVVWSSKHQGPFDNAIYAQLAITSGQFIGNNLQFSDHVSDGVNHGATRVLRHPSNGDFVVLWRDNHIGTHRILGRLFFSDGTPQDSSFLISEDPELNMAWNLSAALDSTERFAVLWSGKKDTVWQIQSRRFQADGEPLGPSEKVNSNLDVGLGFPAVDIAFDLDGTCIIVWPQNENGVSQIYAQRFLADGTTLGNNFRVSVNDPALDQFSASVVLHNGKIITAWVTLEDSTASDFMTWANILDFNNPVVSVDSRVEPSPEDFQLLQNYPNPFNPTTTIRYEVAQRSHIRLVIYNLLGEKINTLKNDDEVMPGVHAVMWDGKNAKGGDVASGLYFIELRAAGSQRIGKMLLIR